MKNLKHYCLSSQILIVIAVLICSIIVPTHQRSSKRNQNPNHRQQIQIFDTANNENENLIAANNSDTNEKDVTYIRASIPTRMFQCIRKIEVLRCMKLFVWQKMENRENFINSGNITQDFLDQFLSDEENFPNLTDQKYSKISDDELTKRLVVNFQRYFKNRDIKLHFIPGVMMQIVPNKDNKLKFSMKKSSTKRSARSSSSVVPISRNGNKKKPKKKNRKGYKNAIIQMAVPVMMMPAILLGTFLPFLLPALKMATVMSVILNNGALMSAIMYALRSHALHQAESPEIVHYSNTGFH